MGVSIAYQGRVEDPGRWDAVLALAREYCRDMEWGLHAHSSQFGRALVGNRPYEQAEVTGLTLLPHFAAEPLPLLRLAEAGVLVDSYVGSEGEDEVQLGCEPLVKTQFAGAAVHHEICEFLSRLQQELIPELGVDDETGFFTSGDEAALQRHLAAGWRAVADRAVNSGMAPGDPFQVGGCTFRNPEGGPVPGEFDQVGADERELLCQLAESFATGFGGLGIELDMSGRSVQDLDLLMVEADQEGWGRQSADEEAEGFAHGLGAYFGRTLVAALGGSWELEGEEGLRLANVGGVGLIVNPFQAAVDRLVHGPAFGFGHHVELYGAFRRHMRPGGPERETDDANER